MFILIFTFLNLFSHVWNLDGRLSDYSCSLIYDAVENSDNLSVDKFPFLASFNCIKYKKDLFLVNTHAHEPVYCLVLPKSILKIGLRNGDIIDSQFFKELVIEKLPKVSADKVDDKMSILSMLPDFCWEFYEIKWDSPEKIIFSNSDYQIICCTERVLTLDLEAKIKKIISKKQLQSGAVFDVRFKDQIILKGR